MPTATGVSSTYSGVARSAGAGCCLAADQYNRRLEKSIGQFDVTHNFKVGFADELPFGRGKAYLTHGPAAGSSATGASAASWAMQAASRLAITSSYVLPLYANTNGRTRSLHHILQRLAAQLQRRSSIPPSTTSLSLTSTGPFPDQGSRHALNGFGNSTRYNPKLRQFPNYNENLSLAERSRSGRSFRLEFRAEAFNVFNRVRFGTGSTNLQDQNFGNLTSSADLLNTPRQLQLALKLYF